MHIVQVEMSREFRADNDVGRKSPASETHFRRVQIPTRGTMTTVTTADTAMTAVLATIAGIVTTVGTVKTTVTRRACWMSQMRQL
jgi:hypothetical protein